MSSRNEIVIAMNNFTKKCDEYKVFHIFKTNLT